MVLSLFLSFFEVHSAGLWLNLGPSPGDVGPVHGYTS